MAYTTAQKDTSSNTSRYNRDRYVSTVQTTTPQLNTTEYWRAQGKTAVANVWTTGAEPTNP